MKAERCPRSSECLSLQTVLVADFPDHRERTRAIRELCESCPIDRVDTKVWRARRSGEGCSYKVPVGALVEVVRNFPRRRVLVRYQGEKILTMQGCLRRAR